MTGKFARAVFALALALLAVGCGGQKPLDGAWSDGDLEYRLRGDNWEIWFAGKPEARGTFVADEGEIALTTTHVHEDGAWLSREKARDLFIGETGVANMNEDDFDGIFAGVIEAFLAAIDGLLDDMFATMSGAYELEGNVLTLTIGGETEILTRR